MKRTLFLAALAAAGCSSSGGEQVLTGRVGLSSGVVGVRAVTDTEIVTAAQVRSDGTFTLAVPAGGTYRLEMLTSSGVLPVVKTTTAGFEHIGFRVCKAQPPWDVGSVGEPGDPGMGGGDGSDDPGKCVNSDGTPCDPNGGGGGMGSGGDPGDCYNADGTPCTEPPKCDPTTDPSCDLGCYDSAGNQIMCPPECDPTTGDNCGEPCDPTTNDCGPPKCDPSDPNCCYDSAGNTTMCGGGSGGDPGTCVDPDGTVTMCCVLPDGTECAPPPPPCDDPADPNTCKDPCMDDPETCACNDSTMCWPQPDPNGPCEGGMEPQNPPGDFGCDDDNTGSDTPDDPQPAGA